MCSRRVAFSQFRRNGAYAFFVRSRIAFCLLASFYDCWVKCLAPIPENRGWCSFEHFLGDKVVFFLDWAYLCFCRNETQLWDGTGFYRCFWLVWYLQTVHGTNLRVLSIGNCWFHLANKIAQAFSPLGANRLRSSLILLTGQRASRPRGAILVQ